MRRHDPLSPGTRAEIDGDPDVAALAQAFNEMLERLEFERRDSARGALMLQEAERRRIARELHDEVGQTLTGVMLQVEGLAATIPAELREQLDELRETARHGAQEVRRIARRLRPEALEDLGLQSALAALATASGDAGPARGPAAPATGPRPDRGTGARRLPRRPGSPDQRRAPRRRDHRRAATRTRRRTQTVLTVADDGRGLAPGSLPSAHGIRGMRERAMLIGAGLTITSPAGGGTQVQLTIPHVPASHHMTPLKTRILIADDHPVVLRGLRIVLNAQPDLEVIAEATDGDQAVKQAAPPRRPPGDPRHLDAPQDRTAGGTRDHPPQARTFAC